MACTGSNMQLRTQGAEQAVLQVERSTSYQFWLKTNYTGPLKYQILSYHSKVVGPQVENSMDPSHGTFLHEGVIGNKKNAAPMTMSVTQHPSAAGFQVCPARTQLCRCCCFSSGACCGGDLARCSADCICITSPDMRLGQPGGCVYALLACPWLTTPYALLLQTAVAHCCHHGAWGLTGADGAKLHHLYVLDLAGAALALGTMPTTYSS